MQLGVVRKPHPINQMIFFRWRRDLLFPILLPLLLHLPPRRVNLSGSLIGGMRDTQDCINFCAARGILPATQLVRTTTDTQLLFSPLNFHSNLIATFPGR